MVEFEVGLVNQTIDVHSNFEYFKHTSNIIELAT
jgi:hypothetical protein